MIVIIKTADGVVAPLWEYPLANSIANKLEAKENCDDIPFIANRVANILYRIRAIDDYLCGFFGSDDMAEIKRMYWTD
jgi:hypothetical protein